MITTDGRLFIVSIMIIDIVQDMESTNETGHP